jgi:hypothetical protein
MVTVRFASRINPLKVAGILSLLEFGDKALAYSPEEFERIANGDAIPTGSIKCLVDHGKTLILNDSAETKFLRLIASSGFAARVRGQTKAIDYVKPWAVTASPYYPDFIIYTNEGKIAFVEIKSILGMCQDENLAKREALRNYCYHNGFLFGFLDAELEPFSSYLSPLSEEEDETAGYFYMTLSSVGGFTTANLKALLKKYPRKRPSVLKRTIAKLVIQDSGLENRYCHDSPYEINATERKEPSPLKERL